MSGDGYTKGRINIEWRPVTERRCPVWNEHVCAGHNKGASVLGTDWAHPEPKLKTRKPRSSLLNSIGAQEELHRSVRHEAKSGRRLSQTYHDNCCNKTVPRVRSTTPPGGCMRMTGDLSHRFYVLLGSGARAWAYLANGRFQLTGSLPEPALPKLNSCHPLQEGQVRLKTLACPINPIDNLVIIGRYPVKPKNTFSGERIIGYDGVFQVVESRAPSNLAEGDYVIPRDHGFGTWRTHATAESSQLLKIPRLDPRAGAILKLGAGPAYLLLEDMHELKPGDWVIQNAATGVISQLVVQFARLRNVHTVSVVRDRPDCGAVKSWLQSLGGDVVISESELRSGECKALEGKSFVLGLDCVFGASGEAMAKLLAPNSTYVNFGLLGGEKLSITSEMILFKGITFRSFRLSKCLASRSDQQVDALLVKLGDLFATGQIQLPAMDVVPWYGVDDVDGVKELEEKLLTAIKKARSNEVVGTKKHQVFVRVFTKGKQVDALLVKLGDLFATGQIQLPALDVLPWYGVGDVGGAKKLEEKLQTAVKKARTNEVGTPPNQHSLSQGNRAPPGCFTHVISLEGGVDSEGSMPMTWSKDQAPTRHICFADDMRTRICTHATPSPHMAPEHPRPWGGDPRGACPRGTCRGSGKVVGLGSVNASTERVRRRMRGRRGRGAWRGTAGGARRGWESVWLKVFGSMDLVYGYLCSIRPFLKDSYLT
ncbi:hypothetical protein JB92DRAFT_2835690 [Gautieria morchelliformis]|nr:hypothetical protein JB92DRAFT_2835690 [Gautieria morchelliformis]